MSVSALYEISVRCSARTAAKTYMPSKPHKFAIRLYGIVEQKTRYIHTLVHNRSGNRTGVSPVAAYLKLFKGLRGAFNRKLDENLINAESRSAVWCLQIMQQSYSIRQPRGRLLVTDNFYTPHLLARQIKLFADGEVKCLGTVWLNNVDGPNRPVIKEAMSLLKDKPRGSWILCQVIDVNIVNKKKTESIAENARYVVFMDRAVVVCYCNDLA